MSNEEARAYYTANPALFTRDGVLPPFEQVQDAVRQRAAASRRQLTVDQWMADLRARADVTLTKQ